MQWVLHTTCVLIGLLGLTAVDAEASKKAETTKVDAISKVTTMLKDMLKQLEKEAEEDEEIYDKLACWCETNDREKTKSIADAEARIEDLTTKIEEYTASSARLTTEIKNLKKEVTKNQQALDKATAIRQKQLAEFVAEEKDLLQSIAALKQAVIVLAKHHGASLLQMPPSHLRGVTSALQQALEKHGDLLKGVLTRSERSKVDGLLQHPNKFFSSELALKQMYAPQSGEVFGIMKQMKASFQENLASAQKDEATSVKAYEELKAAKEKELEVGKDQIDTKTQELADTDQKLANAREDLSDTKTSLAADQEFLAMLKEKCSTSDKEWELRQKTRQLEMEACSKALAMLTSDDAHALFAKTFNPSFIQTRSAQTDRRAAASKLLSEAAMRTKNPRLSAMAVQVRLDAFKRVKKAIQQQIDELLAQQKEEKKHKDWCVEEFNTNQQQTETEEHNKRDLFAKIEDLELTIKQLTDSIKTLKSEIEEMQVQLKRSGEDREKQNKEFQTIIADQRATQKLLKATKEMLADYYGDAFVQAPAGPPPPGGFEKFKKNEGGETVMKMIQAIIDDSKEEEAEAIRSEEDAQKTYEDFVKETNNSIETKSKEIVNKSEEKAKADSDLVENTEAKENSLKELEQLSNYNAELHKSCDYIMKNFEVRQAARDEEVEALRQAIAILSGAKFSDFLQGYD